MTQLCPRCGQPNGYTHVCMGTGSPAFIPVPPTAGPDPVTTVTRHIQQRCPVCEGHRIVPAGFYFYPPGQEHGSTSTAPERCQQCGGTGMIAATETVTYGT